MKQRTLNPRCRAYKNYGARGISVCDEWLEFEPFCEWALSNGWEKGLELDRIDNDGDYCPENCRWVTTKENSNNKRETIYVTVDETTKPESIWNDELHLPYGTVKRWVRTRGTEYASQRIAETLQYGYTRYDYGRNHESIRIMCVETNQVFKSMFEAAKLMKINRGNISKAVNNNSTANGFHFIKLDDAGSVIGGNAKDYL